MILASRCNAFHFIIFWLSQLLAMIRKILVPYDGSNPSESALEHAVSLAKAAGSIEIILLNVVQEIPYPPIISESRIRSPRTGEDETVSEVWKELYHDMKATATKMLQDRIKQIAGVDIRTAVAIGSPADKIVEFAKDEQVDLIVIGNVGLGLLSRLKAIGSVSRAVTEHAGCPVMIVH